MNIPHSQVTASVVYFFDINNPYIKELRELMGDKWFLEAWNAIVIQIGDWYDFSDAMHRDPYLTNLFDEVNERIYTADIDDVLVFT